MAVEIRSSTSYSVCRVGVVVKDFVKQSLNATSETAVFKKLFGDDCGRESGKTAMAICIKQAAELNEPWIVGSLSEINIIALKEPMYDCLISHEGIDQQISISVLGVTEAIEFELAGELCSHQLKHAC